MSRVLLRAAGVLAASWGVGTSACSSSSVSPDARGADAAAIDAAPSEAGFDGGAIDDAGGTDAPPIPPPTLAVACDAALDDVYEAAPAGGDPMTARGTILSCAYELHLSPSEVAARLAAVGVTDVTPTTGAHVLRIAFQTTRRGDGAGVSSARVLLPDDYARTPSPMVVAAHGTAGLADACAPSRIPTQGDALNLPWAAGGWPIVAPDYAGLGTATTQAYGDNDDTARSQLDAARALRALLPAGTLTDDIVMVGHSQGGGVVLSAQTLEASYGAGGEIVLGVAFAPGWPIGRSADGYRFPNVPTSLGDGVPAAIGALFLYAWHDRTLGEGFAGDAFAAPVRDDIVAAVDRDCIFALGASLPTIAPTFGDLTDETFRTSLVSCADGGACTGTAAQLWAWTGENILHADPSGAPLLVYAGSADTLASPNDVSCIVDYLESDAVTPTVCVDESTHFDVVARSASHVVAYASAIVAGSTPPACPAPDTLPACM